VTQRLSILYRIDGVDQLYQVADLGPIYWADGVYHGGTLYLLGGPKSMLLYACDPSAGWSLQSTGISSYAMGLAVDGDRLMAIVNTIKIYSLPSLDLEMEYELPEPVSVGALQWPRVWAARYGTTESYLVDMETGGYLEINASVFPDGSPRIDGHAMHAALYQEKLFVGHNSTFERFSNIVIQIFADGFESGDTSKWEEDK
jgi:hypothetical protein